MFDNARVYFGKTGTSLNSVNAVSSGVHGRMLEYDGDEEINCVALV